MILSSHSVKQIKCNFMPIYTALRVELRPCGRFGSAEQTFFLGLGVSSLQRPLVGSLFIVCCEE